MITKAFSTLLFILFLGYVGSATSGDTPTEDTQDVASTEDKVSMTDDALTGDIEAGEARYNQTCKNCHGAAGKGAASFPKVSGNEISYTKSKLETYREGTKIGPNSSLMIMMAKPLTDEEIANLAAYLKDATP